MFGLREPSHWLLLILVVVLLFGAKRLPDSARALGRSLRIFKSEVKELNKDEKKSDDEGKSSN
jgi:sec-independent protein translocase protein TatA